MELWERLSGKIIRSQDGGPYMTPVLSINAVLPQKLKFREKILFFKCNFSIIPGKLVRTKEWDVRVVWQEPRRTLIVSPAAVAIKLRARRISLCRIKAALMRLSRVFDPFPILLSIRKRPVFQTPLSPPLSLSFIYSLSFFFSLVRFCYLCLSTPLSLSLSLQSSLYVQRSKISEAILHSQFNFNIPVTRFYRIPWRNSPRGPINPHPHRTSKNRNS